MSQVFQLDSQYVAGSPSSQSTDDNKSYVFLFYSPQQPSATDTDTATSPAPAPTPVTENSLLIARYYYGWHGVAVGK